VDLPVLVISVLCLKSITGKPHPKFWKKYIKPGGI
jgi:hypothetical protein